MTASLGSDGRNLAKSIDVSDAVISFSSYAVATPPAYSASTMQNPATIYQHIQETCGKRITTLDYLRKTHEGRVYWFNTLLYTKDDISRIPAYDARKLARKATNFLLLGLSLPTVLELNSTNPVDYLRVLYTLVLEFEAYQQIHPADGSAASSLSRARIPQMFKRATHGAGPKSRRTSSATDIGLPITASDQSDLKSVNGSVPAAPTTSAVSFAASEQELLPGEEYSYLLTPSLPFDPDFFETFATLCDLLIDIYTRICTLTGSHEKCSAPGLSEAFAKADARIRKVMVAGTIKEFEDATRSGIKLEMAGIGRVVLGGLI